jgi:hypothetical protein
MRNGIYRVWYQNTVGSGSAAVILADGRFIACDRTHKFLGSYTESNDHFSAEVAISRHDLRASRPEFPDLDIFHMLISGLSTGETIAARCTYREQPGVSLDVKLVWCSEI